MAKIEIQNTAFDIQKYESQLHIDGENAIYDILKLPNNQHHMMLDGKSYTITVNTKNTGTGQLGITINGRRINTKLHNKLAELLMSMGMESGKKKLKELKAPMPGLVLDVLVKEGQEVSEGQDLLVLEAMKMENAIKSPQAGIIDIILIQTQDKVEKNQVLITFQ
jgi:biotin carboxyl carrier protein